MTDIVVKKGYLSGEVTVPSSKSVAHRMIIASAIMGARLCVNGILNSKDILATIDCIRGMGVGAEETENGILLDATKLKEPRDIFNVNESGSTMRFMLPILPIYVKNFTLEGRGRIGERTVAPLRQALKKNGVIVENDYLPTKVSGQYIANDFTVDASLSSQYITGLLFTVVALGGGRVKVVSDIISKGYIDITIEVLKKFGIDVTFLENESTYVVDVTNKKIPDEINVNADWSSACFFIVAGVLNGDIKLNGLAYPDAQPDSVIVELIRKMGGQIHFKNGSLEVKKSKLKAIDFNADNCPDIVPIMSVACAYSEGVSTITGTHRLRIKESDRVEAVVDMLKSVGVKVEAGDDYIKIYGCKKFNGGVINSYNDHRIAMSGIILASNVDAETKILNIECIEKSYPDFIAHFLSIGGCNV